MQRIVFPTPAEPLPLQLETIGINPDQEPIDRPNGYPCFHWLQTLEGEGELTATGQMWRMTPKTGILLAPNIPHRYIARSACWQTAYITFNGSMATSLVQSFGLIETERVQWDAGRDQITAHLKDQMLTAAEDGTDPSGWQASAQLYRHLSLLRTDARTDHRPSMSKRLEHIHSLLKWLEDEIANPNIGLADMAAQFGIGERQLNERFRELFGLTAYAYFIQLRLRKAKELLPARPDLTVRHIGQAVGFRDTSHFVATFRQKEGMTPDTYRKLYSTGWT